MSSGAGGLSSAFSALSAVTTVKEKTVPSATKSSIVRITQTCEIAASLHSTLRKKKKRQEGRHTDSELHSIILVESLTPQYTSMWAQASVWEASGGSKFHIRKGPVAGSITGPFSDCCLSSVN